MNESKAIKKDTRDLLRLLTIKRLYINCKNIKKLQFDVYEKTDSKSVLLSILRLVNVAPGTIIYFNFVFINMQKYFILTDIQSSDPIFR